MSLLKETINRGTREQIITYSVIFTVLLYIFRSSIPVFKYPFIVLFFCTLGYSMIVIKNRVIPTLSDFFRNYYLIILTTIILICSFLLSKKIYLIIFKDCLNSIILVSFAFIMFVLINSRHGANSFYQGLVKSFVFFAVVISIDSLFKVFNIFTVNPIIDTDAALLIHKNIDYNFAILPVVIGMVGALYLIVKTKSSYSGITYNFFLILFSIVIIFSGSRRGVFVFALLVLTILIAQIPAFTKKASFFKDLGLATRIYVLTSGLLSIIAYLLITGTSYEFKNKALKATGSKNILSSKIIIASKFFKYYQLVNNKMIFTDFYDRFWSAEFNPYDPESGWGRRMHRIVFPLTGKNVEMIPDGAKGYLMDSTCNTDTWEGNAYSYTVVKRNIEIEKTDLVNASVFCYMSEDFNGSWARVICGGEKMGSVDGFEYDTTKKGSWQKLICQVSNVDDIIQAALYFSKTGTVNFSGLTGYIIFAYPQIEIVRTKYNPLDPKRGTGKPMHKPVFPLSGKNVEIVPHGVKGYLLDSTCFAGNWDGNAYSQTTFGRNININENQLLRISVFCYMSEDFNGSLARIVCEGHKLGSVNGINYDIMKKGTWQKLTCKVFNINDTIATSFYLYKMGASDFSGLTGYLIFASPEVEIVNNEFDPRDPDNGWGHRIHKTVFPLTGRNVGIVPSGAKGYLMDRSCNADTWDGDAYSYTVIKRNIDITENNLLEVSVFCYMSEDFSGSWARIICDGKKTGTIDGLNYDMLNKGTWQKLSCKIPRVTDKIDAVFYFCKTGVTNFSDLRGYIIFAYPFYEIRENKTEDLSNLTGKPNPNHYFRANFGNFATSFFSMLLQKRNEKELIRDLASRLISEDTTYYAYKNDLKVYDATNDFVGLRSAYWKFTQEIFLKEYNLKQKIFGGGFSFLNWFSYYFSGDKTKYDYPHNPFLSVLLYSGIFGLIVYLFLLYKVISYYIRYRKEYPLLLYFFLVVLFFSFFSGGSPLDPPIMGFFVVLPFVLHYSHKKKNNPADDLIIENEKNSDNRS